MTKIKYPVFILAEQPTSYIAVFHSTQALQIMGANFNGGFEFNIFKSRPKVIKLENYHGKRVTAEEFFKIAGNYMQQHFAHVMAATLKADPLALPSSGTKLLK